MFREDNQVQITKLDHNIRQTKVGNFSNGLRKVMKGLYIVSNFLSIKTMRMVIYKYNYIH